MQKNIKISLMLTFAALLFVSGVFTYNLQNNLTVEAIEVPVDPGTEELPDSFNLSDEIYIRVENQRSTGACYAFAATSVLESTLAFKQNLNYQFSPLYLAVTSAINGRCTEAVTLSSGGYWNDFSDLFLNGSSIALDSELSAQYYLYTYYDSTAHSLVNVNTKLYEDYNSYKSSGLFSNFVTGIDYTTFDSINGSQKTTVTSEVLANRNAIKNQIYTNGAVWSDIYGSSSNYKTYTNSGVSHCVMNTLTSASLPNHAVTIVGWDDDFAIENFPEAIRPSSPGAYIVLNSWGSSFGESGYFYVSYEDYYIENECYGITSIDLNKTAIYNTATDVVEEEIFSYTSSNYSYYYATIIPNLERKTITIDKIQLYFPLATKATVYLKTLNSYDSNFVLTSLNQISSSNLYANNYTFAPNGCQIIDGTSFTFSSPYLMIIYKVDNDKKASIIKCESRPNYYETYYSTSLGSFSSATTYDSRLDLDDEGLLYYLPIKIITNEVSVTDFSNENVLVNDESFSFNFSYVPATTANNISYFVSSLPYTGIGTITDASSSFDINITHTQVNVVSGLYVDQKWQVSVTPVSARAGIYYSVIIIDDNVYMNSFEVVYKSFIHYSLSYGINNTKNLTYFKYTDVYTKLFSPTKPGYSFAGWYENASFTGDNITELELKITSSYNLYAKWNFLQFTVTSEVTDYDTAIGTNYTKTYDGEDITITVNSYISSAEYHWFLVGEDSDTPLNNDTNYVITSSENLSTLSFKNANQSGEYYCVVEGDINGTLRQTTSDNITVTINKMAGTVSNISDLSKTYDGQEITDPSYQTNSSEDVTVSYYLKSDTNFANPLTALPTNAGMYVAVFTFAEDENSTACHQAVEFTISSMNIVIGQPHCYDTLDTSDDVNLVNANYSQYGTYVLTQETTIGTKIYTWQFNVNEEYNNPNYSFTNTSGTITLTVEEAPFPYYIILIGIGTFVVILIIGLIIRKKKYS